MMKDRKAGYKQEDAEYAFRRQDDGKDEHMADTVPDWNTQIIRGTLHAYVAFDWGEEIDLEMCARLLESEPTLTSKLGLPRRRRTPLSIDYRPTPLVCTLPHAHWDLQPIGGVEAAVEVILFDFATLSLSLRVPFILETQQVTLLARELSSPGMLPKLGREILEPLFKTLAGAIKQPRWSDLFEEYFVFQFQPGDSLPHVDDLLGRRAPWLAGLLRLEESPLARDEIDEAMKQRLQYSPNDLLVVDWASAVLVDSDCEETLQVIQFANLQLLRYRFLDDLLDAEMANSAKWTRWPTPLGRLLGEGPNRRMRELGALNMEASNLFERAGNVLKLVGDMYLARTYRILAARFHLPAWEGSIRRNLEVIEDVYRVVADQAEAMRAQVLEIIIIVLIAVELFLFGWK